MRISHQSIALLAFVGDASCGAFSPYGGHVVNQPFENFVDHRPRPQATYKWGGQQNKQQQQQPHTKTRVSVTDYYNAAPPTVVRQGAIEQKTEEQSAAPAPVVAAAPSKTYREFGPIEHNLPTTSLHHETAITMMEAETMSVADLITTISTTDDNRILYTAMVNLEDLLYEEEGRSETQEDFLRVGGPLAVVTTMLKHPHNMAVQEWGIVTLACASDENPTIQSVTLDVGGVRAILQAMAAHPLSRSIQEASLEALTKVCSPKANAETLATKFDGIPSIVGAMQTFANDEDLVLLGSQLLDRVSNVVKSELLIDAQVISALSTVLQTHRRNKEILTLAGRTMIRMVAI